MIILGHNQFFGINHGSARLGLDKARLFQDPRHVENFLESALDLGIVDLMLSTHPNSIFICQNIRQNKRLASALKIHVLLPYMAKYIRKVNESGPLNMVLDILKENNVSNNLSFAVNLFSSLLNKDLKYVLESLMTIELNIFKGLSIESVFLHNSLSDLVASLNLLEAQMIFNDFIKNKIKSKPGNCTLNTFLQINWLKNIGIESPLIMAPFNPIGHQMSPNRIINETALRDSSAQVIAMSIFASGNVPPKEAFKYIKDLGIKSMIIGTSNIDHLKNNVEIYKELF